MSLGYFEIAEIGEFISEHLRKNGVDSHSDLVINVNKDILRKIDEDFYYRINPNGKEYTPTEGEIKAEFPNLTIQIKARE